MSIKRVKSPTLFKYVFGLYSMHLATSTFGRQNIMCWTPFHSLAKLAISNAFVAEGIILRIVTVWSAQKRPAMPFGPWLMRKTFAKWSSRCPCLNCVLEVDQMCNRDGAIDNSNNIEKKTLRHFGLANIMRYICMKMAFARFYFNFDIHIGLSVFGKARYGRAVDGVFIFFVFVARKMVLFCWCSWSTLEALYWLGILLKRTVVMVESLTDKE